MENLTRIAMINFFAVLLAVLWFSGSGSKIVTNQSLSEQTPQTTLSPTSQPTPKPTVQKQVTSKNSPRPTSLTPTPIPIPPKTVSLLDQVPSHNKMSDCWVTYNGGVYNITGYFGNHPGGDAIIAIFCGRDMTQAFNTMDKIPPKSHSQKAHQLLETYRI